MEYLIKQFLKRVANIGLLSAMQIARVREYQNHYLKRVQESLFGHFLYITQLYYLNFTVSAFPPFPFTITFSKFKSFGSGVIIMDEKGPIVPTL